VSDAIGVLKAEEEFEEIAQEDQLVHPVLFGLQELEKRFRLLGVPSREMGIRDKDPILLDAFQCRFLILKPEAFDANYPKFKPGSAKLQGGSALNGDRFPLKGARRQMDGKAEGDRPGKP
jgi:hypothetical protein